MTLYHNLLYILGQKEALHILLTSCHFISPPSPFILGWIYEDPKFAYTNSCAQSRILHVGLNRGLTLI